MPFVGGKIRPFFSDSAINPSWSPDGASLAYLRAIDGDPYYVANRSGGNAREIFRDEAGIHNHNPVWSPDGQWIYFVHGRPDAGTHGHLAHPAFRGGPGASHGPSRAGDLCGAAQRAHAALRGTCGRSLRPVALVPRRGQPRDAARDHWSRAVPFVAASADGRRIVATVANPSASLWTLPILDRPVDERDIRPFPVPSVRALGPRFGGGTLFYLSSRGGGDGLWRVENGQTSEIWKGSDGPLAEPAAVSRDGQRVAIVVRRAGRGQVTVMNADGADSRDVAPSLDVQGVVDWAPDGTSIVAGATDAEGPGVLLVPFDGKAVSRLTKGIAGSPVWSPSDNLIVLRRT